MWAHEEKRLKWCNGIRSLRYKEAQRLDRDAVHLFEAKALNERAKEKK